MKPPLNPGMPVVLCPDADSAAGWGHLMRMRTLAGEFVVHGHPVHWVIEADVVPPLMVGWQNHVTLVPVGADEGEWRKALAAYADAWVIWDTNRLRAEQLRYRAPKSAVVVATDDYARMVYPTDWVVNWHLGSEGWGIRGIHGTQILAGIQYLPVRNEVLERRDRAPNPESAVSRVLITFGGLDRSRQILRALDILQSHLWQYPSPRVTAVVVTGGETDEYLDEIQERAVEFNVAVELWRYVPDLPELAVSCGAAIAAGGSTLYELCFLGIPTISIVTSPHHRRMSDALGRVGAIRSLGDASELSASRFGANVTELLREPSAREGLVERARTLLDGRGGARLYAAWSSDGGV